MKRVYADYAATTATSPEVLESMLPYFSEIYGNGSSVHSFGREAAKAVSEARAQVAQALGAQPEEIYFTSGGTEADNWAIIGTAYARRDKGNHIITSAIEHHAVLHTCEYLEKQGFFVTYLPVDETGLVSPEAVEQAIRPDTILITIMYANNEIGTIEPIPEIGAIAAAHKIPFHTDAVQAIGNVPIDVKAQHIDMLSLSAHKFYGPKGIGALYVKKGHKLDNYMHGGAQERNKRGGTHNTPGIVGLGTAIEKAAANIEAHNGEMHRLTDKLRRAIEKIPDVRLNGHPTQRLAGNVNYSIRYIEGEALLLSLDIKGIAASSGSACTSGSLDPSHVLLAIGLPHEIAHGSLRLTFGEGTTEEDIDSIIKELPPIVERLRNMSPLYHEKECKSYV